MGLLLIGHAQDEGSSCSLEKDGVRQVSVSRNRAQCLHLLVESIWISDPLPCIALAYQANIRDVFFRGNTRMSLPFLLLVLSPLPLSGTKSLDDRSKGRFSHQKIIPFLPDKHAPIQAR